MRTRPDAKRTWGNHDKILSCPGAREHIDDVFHHLAMDRMLFMAQPIRLEMTEYSYAVWKSQRIKSWPFPPIGMAPPNLLSSYARRMQGGNLFPIPFLATDWPIHWLIWERAPTFDHISLVISALTRDGWTGQNLDTCNRLCNLVLYCQLQLPSFLHCSAIVLVLKMDIYCCRKSRSWEKKSSRAMVSDVIIGRGRLFFTDRRGNKHTVGNVDVI